MSTCIFTKLFNLNLSTFILSLNMSRYLLNFLFLLIANGGRRSQYSGQSDYHSRVESESDARLHWHGSFCVYICQSNYIWSIHGALCSPWNIDLFLFMLKQDTATKDAMLSFSYSLTIGNMDEAYKVSYCYTILIYFLKINKWW